VPQKPNSGKNKMEVKSKYVSPSKGYFEIDNGKSVYRLMEEMTNPMIQDKLAELYNKEKPQGKPVPMNSIQHIELFNDAMNSGDSDLLNFLQKGLQKGRITLTRVIYNPFGEEDETIHNYGTSDSYSIIGDIVGNNNWIHDINSSNALELLLKTKDIKMLNKISHSINQTPMYLWRLNLKPSEKDECVVGFDANDDKLYLTADGSLYDEYPAFLVEQVK